MGITPTLERYFLLRRPKTKAEGDVAAVKLFFLFSFILVCLIAAGVL
jgi:hypothetical protein